MNAKTFLNVTAFEYEIAHESSRSEKDVYVYIQITKIKVSVCNKNKIKELLFS